MPFPNTSDLTPHQNMSKVDLDVLKQENNELYKTRFLLGLDLESLHKERGAKYVNIIS